MPQAVEITEENSEPKAERRVGLAYGLGTTGRSSRESNRIPTRHDSA